MSTKIGLVLSGGGARGAYQVGVISALCEILKQNSIKPHFHFYSGVSAGAINAGFLATQCEDLYQGSRKLVDLWSHLSSERVFYTDAINIGKIGLRWMGELSLGALTGGMPGRALLDTSPLSDLLKENLNFSKIEKNIKNGHLEAVSVSAIDYQTSRSVTFLQGKEDLPSWNKYRRHSERTDLNVSHIMASSAIPLLFPPIQVDSRYFGDGCVRNSHPCGPNIYLGAQKLVVIGVRKQGSTADDIRALQAQGPPSVARVLNVLLNAILLDGVELDIERLQKVNEFVRKVPQDHHSQLAYKPIEFAWISPSVDIGEIATSKSSRLPRIIRYLIKGLGSLEDASEIVSYLLFDPVFCSLLIEVGYEDGMKQKDEILKLFSE